MRTPIKADVTALLFKTQANANWESDWLRFLAMELRLLIIFKLFFVIKSLLKELFSLTLVPLGIPFKYLFDRKPWALRN